MTGQGDLTGASNPTVLRWSIELKRNGRWWTWSAFGYARDGNRGARRNASSLIGRRSERTAEKAANRWINRMERKGQEDIIKTREEK